MNDSYSNQCNQAPIIPTPIYKSKNDRMQLIERNENVNFIVQEKNCIVI